MCFWYAFIIRILCMLLLSGSYSVSCSLFSYNNFMGFTYIIFCCLFFGWFVQGGSSYSAPSAVVFGYSSKVWYLFSEISRLCCLPHFYFDILFPFSLLYLLCSILIPHPVVYPYCNTLSKGSVSRVHGRSIAPTSSDFTMDPCTQSLLEMAETLPDKQFLYSN